MIRSRSKARSRSAHALENSISSISVSRIYLCHVYINKEACSACKQQASNKQYTVLYSTVYIWFGHAAWRGSGEPVTAIKMFFALYASDEYRMGCLYVCVATCGPHPLHNYCTWNLLPPVFFGPSTLSLTPSQF
jgi:hypothetical protein